MRVSIRLFMVGVVLAVSSQVFAQEDQQQKIGVGIGGQTAEALVDFIESFTPEYIEPPEPFMRSIVHAPHGMNSFPFGQISVSKFVSLLSKRLSDRPRVEVNSRDAEIHGWIKTDDNVYILHFYDGDEEVEAIFVHSWSENKDGKTYSDMAMRLDGGKVEPGISLMLFVFGYRAG